MYFIYLLYWEVAVLIMFILCTLQNCTEAYILLDSRWGLSGVEKTTMGGCIGTPRDGTSHSGESSDVSGTSMFLIRQPSVLIDWGNVCCTALSALSSILQPLSENLVLTYEDSGLGWGQLQGDNAFTTHTSRDVSYSAMWHWVIFILSVAGLISAKSLAMDSLSEKLGWDWNNGAVWLNIWFPCTIWLLLLACLLTIICLHSASSTDCSVPWTRTKLGNRAFSVAGTVIWNSLPAAVCEADSSYAFKR